MSNLIDQFKDMTLGELVEFNRQFAATFGVDDAAPVVRTTPPAEPDEPVDEPSAFEVTLADAGPQRINTIKAVRALLGLGLKEAKDLVDATPVAVLENVAAASAQVEHLHVHLPRVLRSG